MDPPSGAAAHFPEEVAKDLNDKGCWKFALCRVNIEQVVTSCTLFPPPNSVFSTKIRSFSIDNSTDLNKAQSFRRPNRRHHV